MSVARDGRIAQTSTCDRCRTLKVKCVPQESTGSEAPESCGPGRPPCRRCTRARLYCTFDYEFKKSGRPPGSISKRPRIDDDRSASSLSPQRKSSLHDVPAGVLHRLPPPPPPSAHYSPEAFALHDRQNDHPVSQPGSAEDGDSSPYHSLFDRPNISHQKDHDWGPSRDSIFGSARTALEGSEGAPWLIGASRAASFDYTLPPPTSHSIGDSSQTAATPPMPSPFHPLTTQGSMPPPPPGLPFVSVGNPTSSIPSGYPLDSLSGLGGPVGQVETLGTWAEFCFFFSLFMRHQHALVPLIHKPSFAIDALNRRDKTDESFRGLLCSIVTYTICQCPVNMMSNDFSRERLLELLEKCQQTSRLIQIRHLSRPSLITAASTELDILSSQATNKPELTAALFSDMQRMVYSLRLHQALPAEGMSTIDVEIGRRIFWHLYGTDKTNVMNGGHMILANHEGVPPLPLEIDDEHLASAGGPDQPTDAKKHTYISGFVAILRIFQILGECQLRHRTFQNDPTAVQDMPTLTRWIDTAVGRLRKIIDGLPAEMRPKDRPEDATAGIQWANICITELCAEFALLDFRLALRPEEDLRPFREKIAKKAYATLSSIPIEYLASNGEAMRGKVLRTILALFNASTTPEELGEGVWDWWSMYSKVQFIQVIPTT